MDSDFRHFYVDEKGSPVASVAPLDDDRRTPISRSEFDRLMALSMEAEARAHELIGELSARRFDSLVDELRSAGLTESTSRQLARLLEPK